MRKHGLIEISKNNVPEDWGNDFISARQDLQNLITRYKREYLRELKEKISEIGKLASYGFYCPMDLGVFNLEQDHRTCPRCSSRLKFIDRKEVNWLNNFYKKLQMN